MKKFFLFFFMFFSIVVFARVAHIVKYNTSCGATVTVEYTRVLSNSEIVEQGRAINQAVCGNRGGEVTLT